MKAQVVLTPPESKHLIAKGVIGLDAFREAWETGWVVISAGTTNMYILKELLGEKFAGIKDLAACGVVTPLRTCITSKMMEFVVKHGHAKVWIFRKGELQDGIGIKEVLGYMGSRDVFVKGANALDPYGKAATFLGAPSGGTIGVVYGAVMAKGIQLIIPVGFEKLIPISVYEVAKELGIEAVDYSMGLHFGMLPLEGKVITEREAIRILTGADAIPIGCGGINGAEGSVILLIKGTDEQTQSALRIIQEIKGEKPIKFALPECEKCLAKSYGFAKCY